MVVIAELVALLDTPVRVVEVVLEYFGIAREITLREVVDVSPEFPPEKVADGLEIVSVRIIEANAPLKGHEVIDAVVYIGVEHP